MAANFKMWAGVFVTILLAGTYVSPAAISPDPCSFDEQIIEGCSLTETLVIGNNGTEPVNITIRTVPGSERLADGPERRNLYSAEFSPASQRCFRCDSKTHDTYLRHSTVRGRN